MAGNGETYTLRYEFYGENDESSRDGLVYETSGRFTSDWDAISWALGDMAFDEAEYSTNYRPIEGTVSLEGCDGLEMRLDLNGGVLSCKVGE